MFSRLKANRFNPQGKPYIIQCILPPFPPPLSLHAYSGRIVFNTLAITMVPMNFIKLVYLTDVIAAV